MPRQARLIFRAPDGHDQEVALSEGAEVNVGRHPQCTLTIQQPSVSRRHARFWFEAGAFNVQDLQSSNGTYVNNQRISRARLSDGDSIRCGDFVLSFREVPSTPVRVEDGAAVRGSDGPRLVGRLSLKRPASIAPAAGPPRPIEARPPELRAPDARPAEHRPAEGRPLEGRPGPPPTPDSLSGRRILPTLKPSSAEASAMLGAASAARLAAAESEELRRLRAEVDHWKAQAEGRALLDGQAPSTADADLAAARAEADALRAEVEAARAEVAEAREAQARAEREGEDFRADVDARAQRISELEQANLRAEEQIRTLTDNSLKLKEQARAQQNQLEEYRREKVDLEVALAEAKSRIEQLQANHEAGGRREAELADAINDLKREVRQKEKAHKEVEKQLEVAEYNLRAVREENENLRLALGEDDSARSGLNRTVDHLRQVVSEKEAIIEQLQAEVRRWELRAQQGEAELASRYEQRAAAAEKARADAEAELRRREATLRELAEQVQLLQAELAEADRRAEAAEGALAATGDADDLRRRLGDAEAARDAFAASQRELQARVAALGERSAALERELAAAEQRTRDTEAHGASSRELMAQLNDLRRLNRDLQSRSVELTERVGTLERELAAAEQRARDADAQGAGGREALAQVNELRRLNRELKYRVESLEADLAQAKAGTAVQAVPPAVGGDYEDLRGRAVELYEAINDVASNLKNNVELVGGYLGDLRPVVEMVVTLANDGGDARLRETVDEVDAAVTIDAAEEVLSEAQEASDSFKGSLRAFREVLQRHGYGS